MKPVVQHIAITYKDGSVAIMQFVVRALLRDDAIFEREPTDAAIEDEIGRAGIDVAAWRRVSPEEVPVDRLFRDAWRDIGTIVVDMPAARDIHRDRLRNLRGPLLAALDIEYQRADETGDTEGKSAVAAEKQALRDITDDPSIEASRTPQELLAAIPDVLGLRD